MGVRGGGMKKLAWALIFAGAVWLGYELSAWPEDNTETITLPQIYFTGYTPTFTITITQFGEIKIDGKLVSDMMEAHGRFCNDVMNFNDSVWKVIRAGITEENIPHTRGYVNGDYMAILTSMDEPVRISFKLKEISFKDFYLQLKCTL